MRNSLPGMLAVCLSEFAHAGDASLFDPVAEGAAR